MQSKKTFFDNRVALPQWAIEFVKFAMQIIAVAIVGVAIISLFLPFDLALRTVLFGIGVFVFYYGTRSLVTYFLARRKRGAGEERTSSEISQFSKG